MRDVPHKSLLKLKVGVDLDGIDLHQSLWQHGDEHAADNAKREVAVQVLNREIEETRDIVESETKDKVNK